MQNILHTIGSIFVSGLLAIGSIFSPTPAPLGATIPVSVAVFQTSLATSLTSSATSMTLVNGTNSAGNALSGYTCFNVDEGTALEEFICGTASGTAISSMIRGVDPVDGDLEVTALKKAHRRGASVKITNYPTIAVISRILNGDENIPNKISYASAPTFVNGNELITKTYVDGIAIAGSPDATTTTKGIGTTSVSPAVSTAPIFVGDNDPRVPTQDENNALVGNNTDIAVGTGNKYVTQTGLGHNAEKYAVDNSSSSTAYTIALSPIPTSITDGMVVYAKIVNANTSTTPTLNVNSLGAHTIVKGAGTALAVGDIGANSFDTFIYDLTNTRWVLQNPSSTFVAGTAGGNKLAISTTPITVASSTAENTLITASIPANTLGTNNAVQGKAYLSTYRTNANSASSAIFRLKYGSTTVATLTIAASSDTGALTGDLNFTLLGNASTSAQIGAISINVGNKSYVTLGSMSGASVGTATEDSTGALNLVVTVQFVQSTSNDTTVMNNYVITKVN